MQNLLQLESVCSYGEIKDQLNSQWTHSVSQQLGMSPGVRAFTSGNGLHQIYLLSADGYLFDLAIG